MNIKQEYLPRAGGCFKSTFLGAVSKSLDLVLHKVEIQIQ